MVNSLCKRGGWLDASAALLFYELKWYNCIVMMMDDYKISDNFQRTEGV